jgi:hypothetical protein
MNSSADNQRRPRIGRRHFLGALGAGAIATTTGGIAASVAHAHEPDDDDRTPCSDFFGRIFQQSAISNQQSAISRQQSAVSNQPSLIRMTCTTDT